MTVPVKFLKQKYWKRLQREVVESLKVEFFKVEVFKRFVNVTLFSSGLDSAGLTLDLMILKVFSNMNNSLILNYVGAKMQNWKPLRQMYDFFSPQVFLYPANFQNSGMIGFIFFETT